MSTVPISTIVNVQISLTSPSITQAGFGTPLILTNETPLSSWGTELIREYTALADVLEDWTSSDDVYLAATKIFSQTPHVESVKIGLETTRVAQVKTLVFSADFVASNVVGAFTFSIGGITYTITATNFTTDNATTLAAITTKITALAGLNATDDGLHTITITSAVAGLSFTGVVPVVTLGASQATAVFATTVANVGPAESLAAISEQDDAYYGVNWVERDAGLVFEMATYIETVRKLYGTVTQSAGAIDSTSTTDIAYLLSASSFLRTFTMYNADVTDYLDAGWMGREFPYDPGSTTWKFKTISGGVADSLTSAQRSALINKNANMYITVGGSDITTEGVTASGEYIDTVTGTDWLQARIEESIYSRLVSLPKVPFTNAGIAIIENEIRAQLENAIRVGFLSGDPLDPDSNDDERRTKPYIITVPLSTEVSSADRANRALTGITFEARAAGAIHSVTIMGSITV